MRDRFYVLFAMDVKRPPFALRVTVFLLHDLWRTARNIRIYAHEALTAAGGIADHTQQIPALDATVGLAAEVLSTAETVAGRLDTLATALSTRARS